MLRYSASIKSVNMRHLMNLKQSLLRKPRSFWRDVKTFKQNWEFKRLMYKCIMYKYRWGRFTAVNVSEQL